MAALYACLDCLIGGLNLLTALPAAKMHFSCASDDQQPSDHSDFAVMSIGLNEY